MNEKLNAGYKKEDYMEVSDEVMLYRDAHEQKADLANDFSKVERQLNGLARIAINLANNCKLLRKSVVDYGNVVPGLSTEKLLEEIKH